MSSQKKFLIFFFWEKKKNKSKGRILLKKKISSIKKNIVWLSIMKKFTNSPEKNHLVSNIKEIFAKNCCWEKRIHRWTHEKKIKKKKKISRIFFCHSHFFKNHFHVLWIKEILKINNSPTKTEYKRKKKKSSTCFSPEFFKIYPHLVLNIKEISAKNCRWENKNLRFHT